MREAQARRAFQGRRGIGPTGSNKANSSVAQSCQSYQSAQEQRYPEIMYHKMTDMERQMLTKATGRHSKKRGSPLFKSVFDPGGWEGREARKRERGLEGCVWCTVPYGVSCVWSVATTDASKDQQHTLPYGYCAVRQFGPHTVGATSTVNPDNNPQ